MANFRKIGYGDSIKDLHQRVSKSQIELKSDQWELKYHKFILDISFAMKIINFQNGGQMANFRKKGYGDSIKDLHQRFSKSQTELKSDQWELKYRKFMLYISFAMKISYFQNSGQTANFRKKVMESRLTIFI